MQWGGTLSVGHGPDPQTGYDYLVYQAAPQSDVANVASDAVGVSETLWDVVDLVRMIESLGSAAVDGGLVMNL